MEQTQDLEQRLGAALARIGAAVQHISRQAATLEGDREGSGESAGTTAPEPVALDPESAAAAEIARLREALAAEQDRNASLDERVRNIRERQDATVATLESRITALTGQLDAQGNEVQRLRMVNVQLREAMRGLREALTSGMADPGQLNRAMQAELDALHATRQAEMSEMDDILSSLEPHVAHAEAALSAGAAAEEAEDARA